MDALLAFLLIFYVSTTYRSCGASAGATCPGVDHNSDQIGHVTWQPAEQIDSFRPVTQSGNFYAGQSLRIKCESRSSLTAMCTYNSQTQSASWEPNNILTFRCCSANTCHHGGTCSYGLCSCTAGWAGDRCDKALCNSKCLNGGVCSAPFTCSCPPNTSGVFCEEVISADAGTGNLASNVANAGLLSDGRLGHLLAVSLYITLIN